MIFIMALETDQGNKWTCGPEAPLDKRWTLLEFPSTTATLYNKASQHRVASELSNPDF
jgi:hypothetical protein